MKKAKNEEYKKGLWTQEEDKILMEYINLHGKGKWNRVPQTTGLRRCGKSCRLRWMNYLSPNIKRGDFSFEEDDLIIRLHNLLGNRWSLIAGRVPGRTDNQIKNHWNTHLSKKLVGLKKVSMTTYKEKKKKKKKSRLCSPTLIPFPQQPSVENEEAIKSKTDKDWFIIDDGMNFYTDEGLMNNYVDGHHLDFVWDAL